MLSLVRHQRSQGTSCHMVKYAKREHTYWNTLELKTENCEYLEGMICGGFGLWVGCSLAQKSY